MATRSVAMWNVPWENWPWQVQGLLSRLAAAGATASMVLIALLGSSYIQTAFAAGSLEYAVKAAFIYKFAPYVEWPASSFSSATSPFSICVVGDDPASALLDQAVAGQQVNSHPIAVKHLQQAAKDSDCEIVYVANADKQIVASNLDALRNAPILTVTDADRTPDAVGIIGFTVRDNRVRFNIDDALAAADGLVISSKLLSLANSVKARH
jgi:hypothetical protein